MPNKNAYIQPVLRSGRRTAITNNKKEKHNHVIPLGFRAAAT